MIRLLCWWKRRPPTPSPDALDARKRAREHRETAARIYSERNRLLRENHFAERISRIYEGRT